MNDQVRRALAQGHLIDITTTGRVSGEARRIELVFHNFGGRVYISGSPHPGHTRAWLRNLAEDPAFTFHLKGSIAADLPATARIITDEAERSVVFAEIVRVWTRQDLEAMIADSPLIEVTFEDLAA
ncbi:MAG: nitroreductase/quinone reductase family protein [Chloroflexota bacterium]